MCKTTDSMPTRLADDRSRAAPVHASTGQQAKRSSSAADSSRTTASAPPATCGAVRAHRIPGRQSITSAAEQQATGMQRPSATSSTASSASSITASPPALNLMKPQPSPHRPQTSQLYFLNTRCLRRLSCADCTSLALRLERASAGHSCASFASGQETTGDAALLRPTRRTFRHPDQRSGQPPQGAGGGRRGADRSMVHRVDGAAEEL
jgi:hypothetical protein